MKIGEYEFKRRYSAAQVIVDIFSVIVLLYIFYITYACAAMISRIKAMNNTDVSLDFLKWQPLIIWCVLGAAVWAVSVFLMVKPRKKPKKTKINEKYVVKYCNIIDTCISCIRLVSILFISELCYEHSRIILEQDAGFSIQLVLSVIIAALILWFTAVRADSISQVVSEEESEKKPREIIEN